MVRLQVEGVFVDLKEDSGFSLNIQIADLRAADARNGSFSTTFDIPLTANNANVFGYVDNLNYLVSNNPSKRYSANLYEDGVVMKEGFVRVVSYSNKVLKANFYSDNVRWFDDLKNKKIADIEALSNLDHVWNIANVIQTWEDGWGWENGYCHPIISYGDKLTGTTFDVDQFPMAVFCKWLFKEIFAENGLSVTGDFWENDPDFNKLILPYSGVDFKTEQGYVPRGNQRGNYVYYNKNGQLTSNAPAGGEAKILIQPDVVNPFTYYNFTNEQLEIQDFINMNISMNWSPNRYIGSYQANISDFSPTVVRVNVYGDVLFDFCGPLEIGIVYSEEQSYITNFYPATPVGGGPGFGVFEINKSDITYVGDAVSQVIFNNVIPPSDSSYDNRIKPEMYGVPTIRINGTEYYGRVDNFDFSPGDIVEFLVKNISPCGYTIDENMTEEILLDIVVNSQDMNSTIFGSSSLPDMTQSEFIKEMLIRHNVFIQRSQTRPEVEISAFSSIQNNLSKAVDWSDKVDYTRTERLNFVNVVSRYGKRSIFLDQNDSNDSELSKFSLQNNEVFGQGVIDIDNDFIVDEKVVLQTKFSPTITISTQIGRLPSINNIDDDDLNQRLLYFQNGVSVGEITGAFNQITLNTPGDTQNTDKFSFAWYKLDTLTPPVIVGNDLSFDGPDGLLVRYFGLLISVLNNPSSVILPFNLNSNDIVNLNLLNPVYISSEQSYFYINKVNQYKGDGTPTNVELIKIA